jgi:hypothetical protein
MQILPNKPQLCDQRSSCTGRNCRCCPRVCVADCWPEVSVHLTETSQLRCQKKKRETCTDFAGSEIPLLRKVTPSRFGKALNTVLSYGSPSNCTTCTVIVMWLHTIIMEVWNDVLKGAIFRTASPVTLHTAHRQPVAHLATTQNNTHTALRCGAVNRLHESKRLSAADHTFYWTVLSTVHAYTSRLLQCQNYSIFTPRSIQPSAWP